MFECDCPFRYTGRYCETGKYQPILSFKKTFPAFVNKYIIMIDVKDSLPTEFKTTVEPCYNDVLGTMKITLLYQVSHYIRVKNRNIKRWDQQNYLVIRGFCYIRPLYNEVPLYFDDILSFTAITSKMTGKVCFDLKMTNQPSDSVYLV